MNWDYGGAYKTIDMDGVIHLPNESKVQVCDWTINLPAFMLEADTLFIDPPWNMGNVNSFYYKADQPHLSCDFLTFSEKLFQRIDTIGPKFLFIEMGKEFLARDIS